MNKKAIWCKIGYILLQTVPLIVVMIMYYPAITSRADKTISFAALIVIIFVASVFKDAFRKFMRTPSVLKWSIIFLVISIISVTLGEQMLILSGVETLAALLSLPLMIIYSHLTRPATANDIVNKLELLKGGIRQDEEIINQNH